MRYANLFLIHILSWVFFLSSTHQLQSYEKQVLLQLRKHLEYPAPLDVWENNDEDLCGSSPTPHMTITCHENSVTELKIMGNKLAKVSTFNGFAVPNQTLSETFSMDSFITTLTRLTNLRALSLVSLGIWGPLPDKIHRLYSLEFLDLSSNFVFGSVPSQMSRLVKLQTLILDSNFFNETLPDWFDSLENLTILSLKNNRLKGQFPSSICKITTLSVIAFSHNRISGKLPDMSTLSSLHLLDLRENNLDSEIPAVPKGLTTVLLSENSFTGKIPEQFGKLDQLQHLDLSFNSLSGTPPIALFSLPNISYLNMAHNKLSGSLPEHLTCGDELGLVDVSGNRLMGKLPSCFDTTSEKRIVKFDGNCFSIDTKHQYPESYCKQANNERKESKKKTILVLVGVIVGIVSVVLLLALLLLVLFRSYYSRRNAEHHISPKIVHDINPSSGISSELLANATFNSLFSSGIISQTAKLGMQGTPANRVFFVEELEEATKKFDQTTFMGEGSLGKLYRGKLENGTYIAIRCLNLHKRISIQNLRHRFDLLSKLHHPHLVGLLGHCIDNRGQDDSAANRVFLVYEYMPNGNFRAHLSESCPDNVLNWSDRLAVLIGVAKAVHFLHTGVIPASLNNRLKTNNILIDEHGIAKLSDYGMSIITEESEKHEAKGEGSKSWQMTTLQDDVYNFGFILLEALVGPIVTGKGEAFLLNEMTSFGSQDGRRRIVDPIVLTTCSQESLSIVISITNKCVSPESSKRPSFEDVLWNLQYAAQVQATADSDHKSDSASQA